MWRWRWCPGWQWPQRACRRQRATFQSWLCPSISWILSGDWTRFSGRHWQQVHLPAEPLYSSHISFHFCCPDETSPAPLNLSLWILFFWEPWMPAPPISTYGILGLQACTFIANLSVWDRVSHSSLEWPETHCVLQDGLLLGSSHLSFLNTGNQNTLFFSLASSSHIQACSTTLMIRSLSFQNSLTPDLFPIEYPELLSLLTQLTASLIAHSPCLDPRPSHVRRKMGYYFLEVQVPLFSYSERYPLWKTNQKRRRLSCVGGISWVHVLVTQSCTT